MIDAYTPRPDTVKPLVCRGEHCTTGQGLDAFVTGAGTGSGSGSGSGPGSGTGSRSGTGTGSGSGCPSGKLIKYSSTERS
jgi:hypothetical protein